jgi:hypothetical protein
MSKINKTLLVENVNINIFLIIIFYYHKNNKVIIYFGFTFVY